MWPAADQIVIAIAWFLAGLVYANFAEWAVHRFAMHGQAWLFARYLQRRLRGEPLVSLTDYRFGKLHHGVPMRDANINIRRHYAHHGAAAHNGFADADFARPLRDRRHMRYETRNTLLFGLAHAPVLFFTHPAFFSAILLDMLAVIYLHRRSHLDPDWARHYLPWHFDHHMCDEPDANFCFTTPLADIVLGTRIRLTAAERLRRSTPRADAAAGPDRAEAAAL